MWILVGVTIITFVIAIAFYLKSKESAKKKPEIVRILTSKSFL